MVQSGKGPPSRGIRVLMLGHESQRVKSPRPSFFCSLTMPTVSVNSRFELHCDIFRVWGVGAEIEAGRASRRIAVPHFQNGVG